MAKNFPKWIAVTKLQVQESSKNIKQDKYQKYTPRYIFFFT